MTSHKFQSITESQWKSGIPRHSCAECSQDYDDPVHFESSWPLIVVIEDCYIPELAPAAITTIAEADSETLAQCFAWAAFAAKANLRGERLN